MKPEQMPSSCGDCPCLDDCDINTVDYESKQCIETLDKHFKED